MTEQRLYDAGMGRLWLLCGYILRIEDTVHFIVAQDIFHHRTFLCGFRASIKDH